MKLRVLIFLFLCTPIWGLSEVKRIVDPDEGDGYHYSSLDAWEDDLGDTTSGNLPNDDEIAIAQCRSSEGTADTTAVLIDGWTTDSTRCIEVKGIDFPSDGVWDDSKYVLHNNDSDVAILNNYEDYVNVRKLQIKVTSTSTNNRDGILCFGVSSPSHLIIDSCYIKGVCSGTGNVYGILIGDADLDADIYNTIVEGFESEPDASHYGIYCSNANSCNVFNCSVYGCHYGIRQTETGGTVTIKNCAVGNCAVDISGTVTMDYIVSDDDHSGDVETVDKWWAPTNGAGDWSLDFETPGSDFRLKATAANLIDNGVADLFDEDDDIIGTARPQGEGWDIGAFEYVVPAAGNPQVIFITN